MRARRHATRADDRKAPSDAPCPGIARRVWPVRDRIVSAAMMEGGAFIQLKSGLAERESSKQAEALLAGLPTILGIRLRHGREPVAKDGKLHSEVVQAQISARYG